jgi:hypothetical protein
MRSAMFFLLSAVSFGAHASTPPPGMMANAYRLMEAAAVVTVCTESDAFKALPGEKAAQMAGFLSRLGGVVGAIGRHYADETLAETFEATRRKIAGETAMRGYVKTKYQYCGDALFEDMTAYVQSNETLINGYFAREAARRSTPPARSPSPPAPTASPPPASR